MKITITHVARALFIAASLSSGYLCAFGQSSSAAVGKAQGKPEPWQSSWGDFVGTYNRCVHNPRCDLKQFVGKDVTWEGVA